MSKRISKRGMEAYISNLRSRATDDCMEAHKGNIIYKDSDTYHSLVRSAKVKREIADELEGIISEPI